MTLGYPNLIELASVDVPVIFGSSICNFKHVEELTLSTWSSSTGL